MSVDGPRWESLLEINPSLGHCRVTLQRRLHARLANSGDYQQKENGYDNGLSSAQISSVGGFVRLQLRCAEATGVDVIATTQTLSLDLLEGLEVRSETLCSYVDHLSVTLKLPPDSRQVEHLLALGEDFFENSLQIEEREDGGEQVGLLCPSCACLLLDARGKATYRLPTSTWQACTELLACEECAPVGAPHVRPLPGRIYVSSDCILVSTTDTESDALALGNDGLVRCACGFELGETLHKGHLAEQGPKTSLTDRRQGARPVLAVCREAWKKSGAGCRSAGVSLYKHRVAIRTGTFRSENASGSETRAGYTPAAAVGRQVIGLRLSSGSSRFAVVPKRPVGTHERKKFDVAEFETALLAGCGRPGASGAACIEVRIVAAEVLLAFGSDIVLPDGTEPKRVVEHISSAVGIIDTSTTTAPPERVWFVQRAAKVYFRCSDDPGHATGDERCTVIVVPQLEFEAVARALQDWNLRLPPSLRDAPIRAGVGAAWLVGFLPLPPRDHGLG